MTRQSDVMLFLFFFFLNVQGLVFFHLFLKIQVRICCSVTYSFAGGYSEGFCQGFLVFVVTSPGSLASKPGFCCVALCKLKVQDICERIQSEITVSKVLMYVSS